MSKIEKLQIQGIRSFGNEAAAINIFSPLTLIVGYNGSGKTTVIECLKYATTGEMPPNSKGGAFIHDPKLTGERDQWAQVKMQFKATNGARMVITRNLQLTIKKATRQTRAMECNLVMSKDGEKTSISSRVTELDAIMPQYLGVSKAILENVIFCHQDESLWPMSEPKALKTKFDAIFEAQKYTKAIENIRLLRKKHKDDLEKLRISEQHAKSDKDKADAAKQKSIVLSREIESLHDEAAILHAEAEQAKARALTADKSKAQFTQDVELLKAYKKERDWFLHRIQVTEARLEKREESDEMLQTQLETHQERLKSSEAYIQSCRERHDELAQSIKQHREDKSGKEVDAARYRERKNAYERRLRERNELVQKIAEEYDLRSYDIDPTRTQMDDFMARLGEIRQQQDRRITQVGRSNAEKREKIKDILDTLNGERSATQQKIKSLHQQLDTNDNKIKSYQSTADSALAEIDDHDAIERDVASLQSRLETTRAELNEKLTSKQCSELTNRIRESEEKREKLDSELIQHNKNAQEHAKIDLSRTEARTKKINLDVLTADYREHIEAALNAPLDLATIETDLSNLLDGKHLSLKEGKDSLEALDRGLQQLEYNLGSTKEQNTRLRKELSTGAEQVRRVIDGVEPEEYPEVLSERQENRDIRANDVKSFEVLKKWYGDCILTAQSENPACRLCKRSFESEKAVERFIKTLERSVSESALRGLKDDLSELEQSLCAARDVRGTYDHWQRLKKDDLPRLEKQIEELNGKRRQAIISLEKANQEVRSQEVVCQQFEEAAKLASILIQARAEWKLAEEASARLIENQQESRATRDLCEIQDELDEVKRKINEYRDGQGKLQADEWRLRETITHLELNLSTARDRKLKAATALEKKDSFMRQITELKEANKEHWRLLQLACGEKEELEPRLQHEQRRRDIIDKEGRDEDQRLRRQVSQLTENVRGLTRVNQEIRDLVDEGVALKLEQCEHEVQALDRQILTIESDLSEMAAEKERVNEELLAQGNTRSVIEDNIRYRKDLQDVAEIEEKIERLSRQNADADHERLDREHQRWQRIYELKSTEKSSKLGSIKAKDDQLVNLLKDWDSDYHDAALKYRRAHIEVETTKAAVEDLGRYGSALDQAIMKYHSLKMEEINRIIEELWKRTYQGTDVDTILIRSDNESTKGNRSYNYRVCMIKQDAEMDMRGRCSAGQRVLASIIIRLALAECFGVNCGLIALDEPTTNLDRDNIRSLAESLHDIIDARRGQSNFQLIVITHDEDFLRYMRCSDFCENYFRVQRNDRQKSEIWRNSIADVM